MHGGPRELSGTKTGVELACYVILYVYYLDQIAGAIVALLRGVLICALQGPPWGDV